MKLIIYSICLIVYFSVRLYSQGNILFTYVDYKNEEVRAAVCDGYGGSRIDLGFNKTYLPIWFNGKIILNSLNYIWSCEINGENFSKIGEGFRASSSLSNKYFAFYTQEGIAIFDSSYKLKKELSLNVWTDVSITWLNNDSIISFFDTEKESTVLFNIETDSLYIYGKDIYHPIWNKKTGEIVYNKILENGNFAIFKSSLDTPNINDSLLTLDSENAIVPVWSNNYDKIAYMRIKEDSLQSIDSDMMLADIILYDFPAKKHYLISGDAGYTDQAYPQFSFDDTDENLFYTALSQDGSGIIKKINIKSLHTDIITKDLKIDERIPLFFKLQ
ncbi:MAG: hypothetical protein AB9882_14965 [Ignavibacteriaceae bacterium]